MSTRLVVVVLVLALVVFSRPVWAGEELTSEKDKISYSIGLTIGKDFKNKEIEVNPEAFLQGLKDGHSGAEPRLSLEEREETMRLFGQQLKEKQEARQKARAKENKEKGAAFLAENKGKEGVKTLESGLQYQVLKEGTGKQPKADDTVTVHYKGTTVDGREFDSSYKRGQPATFKLDRVIKGWTEGVRLMKEGAKWRLFIPPDLAYGASGAGAAIGPEETLIFEIELIKVGEPEK